MQKFYEQKQKIHELEEIEKKFKQHMLLCHNDLPFEERLRKLLSMINVDALDIYQYRKNNLKNFIHGRISMEQFLN